jgi:hypothetical protein
MAGVIGRYRRSVMLPVVLVVLVVLSFNVNKASGQAVVYDSLTDARLNLLSKAIHTDHLRTERWWYGWLGAYSAATIGQGVIYFTSSNKSTRQDMALGAATTLLGAAGQFITPFIPNKEFSQFANLPERSDEDKLQKLAAAEKLLSQWSERERQALTWQNHILSTAVNLGGGLITWLGFKRTLKDGIVNFAINEVITETQIWIQPTYAKRYYKKYCLEYLNGSVNYSYKPDVTWYVEAVPGGIGLKAVF